MSLTKSIRYLSVLCVLSISTHALGQENTETEAQQAAQNEQVTEANPREAIQQNSDGVLRLEQTIRANKEQPQVLTIVPWQLPSHQRINESQAWQPVVQALPSIERGQFLRDLAVVDDILALQAKRKESPEQAQ